MIGPLNDIITQYKAEEFLFIISPGIHKFSNEGGSSSRISTSLWDYNRQSSTGKTHRDSRSSNNAHERDNHHLKLTHHQGHCCLHRVRLPKFQTTRPSLALGAKISAGLPALTVDWLMSNLAYASRHYTSKEKSMLDCLSLSSVSEKIETTYFC